MLHRLADGLTAVLSSALWMGAGIRGDKASGAGRSGAVFNCCRLLVP